MEAKLVKARDYGLVAIVLVLLHGALFVRDVVTPDSFLRGDRAHDRIAAIQGIIDASHSYDAFIKEAVANGLVGDYGVHAAFFALGGRLTVIGFQIVLAILSALTVSYIAKAVLPSRRFVIATGLIYGLLPQSIAFPHVLVSEGVSNPMLIFGTGAIVCALRSERDSLWSIGGGLAYGIAALVRPGLLLVPLMALGLLIVAERRVRLFPVACLGLVGMAPFFLWCFFIFSQTGQFGPGDSTQDLRLNYSFSVARVLQSEGLAPADGSLPPDLPIRISTGKFIEYMRAHPRGFAELYAKSLAVAAFDSGIGRLYVDLLGIGAENRARLQGLGTGWRAQLARDGALKMLSYFWQSAPGILLAGLIGGIVFSLINVGLAIGYVISLRRGSPLWSTATPLFQRWTIAFLLATPIYVLGTSLIVAYASSRHRSPGDFAWMILAYLGWIAIATWRRSGTLTYPVVTI